MEKQMHYLIWQKKQDDDNNYSVISKMYLYIKNPNEVK